MKDIKLREIIILIILSLLIIPAISLKNSVNDRVESESTDQFIASILMIDLFEKTSHGINFSDNDDIKWNPKYFSKYTGKSQITEFPPLKKIRIELSWPKSEGNFLEFEHFSLETDIFDFPELKGSLYE